MINTQIQRIYTINTLILIIFVNRDISNVVNINVFEQFWFKVFDINYVVVKIIGSIFVVNMFDFSHL